MRSDVIQSHYNILLTSTGAKVVQFCGHRLHVHPSFQLFMSTPIFPTHVSPSLASQVSVINFSPSLPLAEDLLLNIAFNMATGKGVGFIETCEGIASYKAELLSLDGEMFSKLPVNDQEECYWWSTEKIANIVAKKNEVRGLLLYVL